MILLISIVLNINKNHLYFQNKYFLYDLDIFIVNLTFKLQFLIGSF